MTWISRNEVIRRYLCACEWASPVCNGYFTEKLSTERELAWQKQKSELEQHYSKLLAEVHVRSKVRPLFLVDFVHLLVRQKSTRFISAIKMLE